MPNTSDKQFDEPSLEEEVQRVLRAGEQAKAAAEHSLDEQADTIGGLPLRRGSA